MKKSLFSKNMRVVVISYIIFFALFAFILSCSFLLFFSILSLDTDMTQEQIATAATATFINMLFVTAFFTLFDIIRRKITVERPIKQITTALNRITSGDFEVRLKATAAAPNFAEIMETINTMTEELSGVETLRNDFISNVSHEMKTPLAVIGNYATLLQNPELSEEKRVEYAKNIAQSSGHLAELITNILKLNKLENQQIFPKTTPYNLSEQLCECLLSFEKIWEDKNIDIDTDFDEDVFADADSELLSIVWNNLLSNAFKFTDNGGKVSVSLKSDKNFATVTVTDTGCGMTAETGNRIFEKFYQGDTSHSVPGNGLGLTLVKRIIDITNGEISVNSILHEGSTFTVKFPLS
ncbi:MAG: HAMP domain-containing histidine kinase [Clostridia bacterium]|nr:HAMP domain-containing histidine kinase [Clostridia bacterium]